MKIIHTFYSENLKRRDKLGELGVDGRMLKKQGVWMVARLNWLMIEFSGGLL